MTQLIGINGRLHSGKDTVFGFINDWAQADGGFAAGRVAFADKLKLSAARSLGFLHYGVEEAVELCNGLKEAGTITVSIEHEGGKEFSGREYLQWYGTEAHRDVFDSEFWVDALLPQPYHRAIHDDNLDVHLQNSARLKDRFPADDIVVVTDVRFPNEAERILRLGGDVWLLDAEERLGPLSEDAHPSEHPLPPSLLTHVIYNNGTLEELDDSVRAAMVGSTL